MYTNSTESNGTYTARSSLYSVHNIQPLQPLYIEFAGKNYLVSRMLATVLKAEKHENFVDSSA